MIGGGPINTQQHTDAAAGSAHRLHLIGAAVGLAALQFTAVFCITLFRMGNPASCKCFK